MIPGSRNLVGTLTTVLWLGVGVFTVFCGVDRTWRATGFLVIAVGVLRGALLLRDWKKN